MNRSTQRQSDLQPRVLANAGVRRVAAWISMVGVVSLLSLSVVNSLVASPAQERNDTGPRDEAKAKNGTQGKVAAGKADGSAKDDASKASKPDKEKAGRTEKKFDRKDIRDRIMAKVAAAKKESRKDNRAERLALFTEEREAAALAFVTKHHPELKPVLEQLKAMKHVEYRDAIMDIFLSSENIARIRANDPELADIMLSHWEVKSKLDLAIVWLRKDKKPEQIPVVRALMNRQHELRIAQLELEQKRLERRAASLKETIASAKANQNAEVEERLSKVTPAKLHKEQSGQSSCRIALQQMN